MLLFLTNSKPKELTSGFTREEMDKYDIHVYAHVLFCRKNGSNEYHREGNKPALIWLGGKWMKYENDEMHCIHGPSDSYGDYHINGKYFGLKKNWEDARAVYIWSEDVRKNLLD